MSTHQCTCKSDKKSSTDPKDYDCECKAEAAPVALTDKEKAAKTHCVENRMRSGEKICKNIDWTSTTELEGTPYGGNNNHVFKIVDGQLWGGNAWQVPILDVSMTFTVTNGHSAPRKMGRNVRVTNDIVSILQTCLETIAERLCAFQPTVRVFVWQTAKMHLEIERVNLSTWGCSTMASAFAARIPIRKLGLRNFASGQVPKVGKISTPRTGAQQ